MKINIVTALDTFLYRNYGSVLQAYSLQTVLKGYGHACVIIRKKSGFSSKIVRFHLSSLYSYMGKYIPVVRQGIDWFLQSVVYRPKDKRKLDKFKRFIEKYISVSSCAYTRSELMSYMPEADAYICGSDQVWHTIDIVHLKDWSSFLCAVPGRKRIAYAASASWGGVGEEWIEVAKRFLPDFHAVSVREESGVAPCMAAGVKRVFVAADPVLLLPAAHYEQMISPEPIIKEKYLLFYILNVTDKNCLPLKQVEDYCESHHLKLVVLSSQQTDAILESPYNETTGPLEFLNLIRHAEAVITNSFHASVFSAIFQRPFAVCLQNGETSSENVRFFSTLARLDQAHRIFEADNLDTQCLETPPYDIEAKVSEWRKESLRFLQNALQTVS